MPDLPLHPEQDESLIAIWRVGLVAYRAARHRFDEDDFGAGRRAIMEAFPQLSFEEASAQLVAAVSWASREHNHWLFRSGPKREWIWPPDHRGVGHRRNPGYEDA